jgi:hypothetical protein
VQRKGFNHVRTVYDSKSMPTKCSHCGAENPDGVYLCRSCGRLLAVKLDGMDRKPSAKRRPENRNRIRKDSRQSDDVLVSYRTVPGKMKLEYMHSVIDPNLKCLDGLQKLLAIVHKPKKSIDELLQEAAELISRQLGIENVAIGLRDPKDGLYRYRALVGFREDALDGHKQIAYTRSQFYDDKQFVGSDISKFSRLYLTEDNVLTEEELKAFNRPGLLTATRSTDSDSLEGDYIDVKILGVNDDLLGWIEISGTRTMKLPDATTLRWVEAIGSIIAAAITVRESSKG